jgi:hypothetical protein
MKRFSIKVFVVATLLHIFGTILLIYAGFAELRAMKRAMETGQPEQSFLWLTIWAWIWQPINMVVQFYREHHPQPVVRATSLDQLASVWGPTDSFLFLCLPWSVVVGICFGFLMPCFSRWRHRIA